jgi:hypothetical protein
VKVRTATVRKLNLMGADMVPDAPAIDLVLWHPQQAMAVPYRKVT